MPRITWWPERGPIDLAHHDLPHPAADTEWWYVNSHLRLVDGRTVGVFAAFFRIISAALSAISRVFLLAAPGLRPAPGLAPPWVILISLD